MKMYCLKNDRNKVVYILLSCENGFATIKGYTKRIIRRVDEELLEEAKDEYIQKEDKISNKYISVNQNPRINKVLCGKVLHIDGDKGYLESCLNFYEKMNIYAWGIYIKEKEIENKIIDIIQDVNPDIVVITGHDAFTGEDKKDLDAYENSKTYIKILKKIRCQYSFDELVVVIGACASHYEALIASGANFASSPGRINIHTYDPAVVACKVATTSCNKTVDYQNIIKHILGGKKAIGGVETKGKMKIIY